LKSKGFTLLEVLLTISILAVLAVLAAQTIQQSVKSKAKIQSQVDDLSRIRDALRLMERDIALAYHHRDYEKEIEDTLKKLNQPAPAPGVVPPPPPPVTPREAARQDPTTHFIGADQEMNFVTMNNSRIMANVRQADFVEVGYSLKACRTGGGQCLWRRMSPLVDSDVTKGGNELALLDHVQELSFRYIGRGKQDWNTEWRTDQGGDGITKNSFPWAVEISLTFLRKEGDAEKKYAMQIVAPIHFPNNSEGTNASSAAPPGP
jgi:prepilin-type N-terminal cleavage/methylation domain-containing protein